MVKQVTEETTRHKTAGDNDQDELDALRDQLAEAQAQAEENWNAFLRARADLENYRKRVERDFERRVRRGKEDLLLALLGVMDDFDRALATADEAGFRQGVEMIYRQLEKTLIQEGVESVPAVGEPFDPAVHEAVAAWECDEYDEETVTDEIRRGYLYGGDLLRCARVRVARPSGE